MEKNNYLVNDSSVKQILQIAENQVGVTEYPSGSNNVLYNTEYYGHSVSGSSYPWCVVFLWWLFKSSGQSQAFYGGGKTASCTSLKDYYSKYNRWVTSGEPDIGDIIIFDFGSDGDIDHCGLLIDKTPDAYITIEGNTSFGTQGSQDNGGAVAKRERYRSSILGWCKINYSSETTNGGAVDYSASAQISDLSSPVIQKSQSLFNTDAYSFETGLRQTEITRDSIIQVDREYNDISSQSNNLLSYPSLVEAPYILVKIGDFVFGQYSEKRSAGKLYKTYPNFITALDVMKINGQVNVYTIKMLYQVQYMDDPNFVDKILSSVGYGKIKISYGDFASPSFIYKEEEAIITKVTTNVDFSSSKIEYTISCTSSALSAQGTNFSFQRYSKKKPSDVIKEILKQDEKYHLSQVFPGLTGDNLKKNFRKFIASDDLAVEIPAQQYMDPLSYINYLVSCMIPQEDTVSAATRSATYYMTIHDDSYADYSNVGGTYFKVTKIISTYKTLPTFNTYSVDVGYPGGDHPGENLVMNFSLKDDNSWALLYDYSQSDIGGSQANYSYSINNQGQAVRSYSPNITQNAKYGKTTPAMKSWWTRMTEFPISATLTIKGLVRAAMLMTYLRVNTYFYGKKHVSSGLYVITKQEDRIDGSGYRTTLSLTRIAGESEYIERKKYTQISEVITGIKKTNMPISEPIADEVMAHWGPAVHNDNEIVGYENDRYIVPSGMRLYVLTEKTAGVNDIPPIYTNPNDQVFIDFMDGLYTGTDLNKFVVRPLLKGELDQEIYEEQFPYPFTENQIIAHPVTIGGSKVFDPEGNLVSIAAANQYGMVQFEINGQVFFHPITYDALIDTEVEENWRTGQNLEKINVESN